MMRVKPHDNGSRTVDIDTPYLLLRVTVAVDGSVTTHAAEVRDPRAVVDIAARVAACESCDSCQGVTLTLKGRDVYKVKCRDCGCGGLSLIAGRCPLGKW